MSLKHWAGRGKRIEDAGRCRGLEEHSKAHQQKQRRLLHHPEATQLDPEVTTTPGEAALQTTPGEQHGVASTATKSPGELMDTAEPADVLATAAHRRDRRCLKVFVH